MASHGKVLDLLDDRYLDLQDVVGNIEPLPTLVPYEDYTQNVLVYRMDTDHEVFLGLVQDFTYRRAYEVRKELWTWLVQWEVDNSPPTQQLSSPKKVRLDVQPANALSRVPTTPRKSPALTIFERRTLDGALMLEEDMLRILIDIVQVASSLVPNFIEFLYRWVDYYEGDGKALKAALRCEIPSLWDFEYHPLVLPQDRAKDDGATNEVSAQASGEREERARSASASKAAELRQSSPTKKMHARPKPDLAAIELQTFYSEESERLQYREVKFGIQPPKLEEPLPPLINIPRDIRKRTKYYAACHRSRQRALYLLLEAGVTMRQINNYQKLQTAHPRETLETGDGNGLRNYQKDAKYAQAHYELEEKQIKQREISISNKLAVEAQLAATHAIPDGAAGLPLIPPTPSCARKPGMAAEMMQRIKQTRTQSDEGRINIVPRPLLGLMKSRMFEGAQKKPELRQFREMFAEGGWYSIRSPTIDILPQRPMGSGETTTEDDNQEGEIEDGFGSANNDDDDDTGKRDEGNGEGTTGTALFDPNVFMRLRRQQEAANSITKTGVSPQPTPFTLPAEQLVPQPSLETATGLGQQTPAQRQRMLSETFNTRFAVTQTDLQAHNSTEVDPNTGNGIHGRPTLPFPSPASSSPTPPSIPPHPKYARIQEAPVFRISPGSPSFTPSSTASAQPPSSEAMLPPPHPGIARNAPSPLTLSLPKPSPFNTLAPQIFATSPFLAAPVESGTPIQVYIPRIIAPGNGIGPGGTRMGDGGSIETDALMLGHENIDTGKLVLTKAILLPVGVWENTLRKVRNGRWSVLETYACPASHPASGKGKGKAGDEGKGCHKAVYDKLVQAYSVMSSAPTVRENELTKRWRTSRGPMTSSDRGAVWEGWGVYVDREIEMSVEERRDAMRKEAETVHKVEDGFAEDYGPYSEPDEALRRRREMEELMDEDEDEMDG
ncbi:hypothetical protein N0V86_006055 [Didymella sp. IMI 355093]|nr:hypothetical protein N0V86_006055 [Didymella sp. IMI 355093]